jgi:hypothetical protein
MLDCLLFAVSRCMGRFGEGKVDFVRSVFRRRQAPVRTMVPLGRPHNDFLDYHSYRVGNEEPQLTGSNQSSWKNDKR